MLQEKQLENSGQEKKDTVLPLLLCTATMILIYKGYKSSYLAF